MKEDTMIHCRRKNLSPIVLAMAVLIAGVKEFLGFPVKRDDFGEFIDVNTPEGSRKARHNQMLVKESETEYRVYDAHIFEEQFELASGISTEKSLETLNADLKAEIAVLKAENANLKLANTSLLKELQSRTEVGPAVEKGANLNDDYDNIKAAPPEKPFGAFSERLEKLRGDEDDKDARGPAPEDNQGPTGTAEKTDYVPPDNFHGHAE